MATHLVRSRTRLQRDVGAAMAIGAQSERLSRGAGESQLHCGRAVHDLQYLGAGVEAGALSCAGEGQIGEVERVATAEALDSEGMVDEVCGRCRHRRHRR